MTNPDGLAALQRLALETLNDILADLYRQSGVDSDLVYEALLVGNSTMLHLVLGVDARSISVAPFVPVFDEAVELAAAEVGLSIHPEGWVGTLPLIGAYVGADTVGRDPRHRSGQGRPGTVVYRCRYQQRDRAGFELRGGCHLGTGRTGLRRCPDPPWHDSHGRRYRARRHG